MEAEEQRDERGHDLVREVGNAVEKEEGQWSPEPAGAN